MSECAAVVVVVVVFDFLSLFCFSTGFKRAAHFGFCLFWLVAFLFFFYILML